MPEQLRSIFQFTYPVIQNMSYSMGYNTWQPKVARQRIEYSENAHVKIDVRYDKKSQK